MHLGLFFCHAFHSVAHISLVLFCSHRRAHRTLHAGFQTTEQYLKVSDCVDISISRRVVDTLGAREHAPGEVILARTPLQVWILTAWWCVPEAFLCQVPLTVQFIDGIFDMSSRVAEAGVFHGAAQ